MHEGPIDLNVEATFGKTSNPRLQAMPTHAADRDPRDTSQKIRAISNRNFRHLIAAQDADSGHHWPFIHDFDRLDDDRRLGLIDC